jgi:hypothetical protein
VDRRREGPIERLADEMRTYSFSVRWLKVTAPSRAPIFIRA